MLERLHEEMTFDTDPTQAATTAAEAFALKRGVCQDFTHIFIAAARSLGIPARYVGGYFHRGDGVVEQDAGHAWAEAYVPELGWIALRSRQRHLPHRRPCAGRRRARLLGAAPVRGTRYGGGGEAMSVKVRVDQAFRQSQNHERRARSPVVHERLAHGYRHDLAIAAPPPASL